MEPIRNVIFNFDEDIRKIVANPEITVFTVRVNWDRKGRVPNYLVNYASVETAFCIFDKFFIGADQLLIDTLTTNVFYILTVIRSIVKYAFNTWGLYYNWHSLDVDNKMISLKCHNENQFNTQIINALMMFGDCREHAILSAFLFAAFKQYVRERYGMDKLVLYFDLNVLYTIIWLKKDPSKLYTLDNMVDYDHVFNVLTFDGNPFCFYDALDVSTDVNRDLRDLSLKSIHMLNILKVKYIGNIINTHITDYDTRDASDYVKGKLINSPTLMTLPIYNCGAINSNNKINMIVSVVDFWKSIKSQTFNGILTKPNEYSNDYTCGKLVPSDGSLNPQKFADVLFSYSFYKEKNIFFENMFKIKTHLFTENVISSSFLDMLVRQFLHIISLSVNHLDNYFIPRELTVSTLPSNLFKVFVTNTKDSLTFIESSKKGCHKYLNPSDPFVGGGHKKTKTKSKHKSKSKSKSKSKHKK